MRQFNPNPEILLLFCVHNDRRCPSRGRPRGGIEEMVRGSGGFMGLPFKAAPLPCLPNHPQPTASNGDDVMAVMTSSKALDTPTKPATHPTDWTHLQADVLSLQSLGLLLAEGQKLNAL